MSRGVIAIFLNEALEIYYYDVPDKSLYSFLEFVGPGVYVDEVSKEMCIRYVCVMDAISVQAFYRELFAFLRWAYSAGYTKCNLACKIKS
jgi:predicted DNA-binding transcriptional regulator